MDLLCQCLHQRHHHHLFLNWHQILYHIILLCRKSCWIKIDPKHCHQVTFHRLTHHGPNHQISYSNIRTTLYHIYLVVVHLKDQLFWQLLTHQTSFLNILTASNQIRSRKSLLIYQALYHLIHQFQSRQIFYSNIRIKSL